MTEVTELKRLTRAIHSATTPEETVGILRTLTTVVVTESSIRDSKVGLAVGKLRTNASKEVADLAKELVRKWKTEVEREKLQNGTAGHRDIKTTPTSKAAPLRKGSVADSTASGGTPTPVTPTAATPSSSFSNGAARSSKSDGVKVEPTSDRTRNKCAELVYDALASDSTSSAEVILQRAMAIELTVFEDSGRDTTKEYKNKMRSLYLNLKDKANPELRENVLSGAIPVPKFCRMTAAEMASKERKEADKKLQSNELNKTLAAQEPEAETGAFQCSRCKQKKTRYRQAQTRSADEPMTTFVTCTVCGNRWKFS